MLAFRTSIVVIVLGLISTITCQQTFSVKCSAGLKYYDKDHFLCQSFDDDNDNEYARTTYTNWKCLAPMQTHPSGSDCVTIPDQRIEKSVKLSSATCRDIYSTWVSDKFKKGILCRTTTGVRVNCKVMQAASFANCEKIR
ncbi:uncharacterized protein MELLADRAFT_124128 [Melampsora larici-populina 98AG31]|uniref:Secreted protein n=1 Tax=Melampsora larici-populina (strain 98AG31 / pathotype 3-4-7) TaxID=747676 RepID=F4SC06_MELLP|nr:uncharacterized protein MELLADRAFT_124128 [Melampsora larici-populina 98AG31]EGF97821.1 secreted protein [Melampsora larici-populina 98AG31]